MEAAACYIGECRDPERDAKIAMNLEGGYGLFIYTLIPIAFIVVLGAKALGNSDLVDPNTIFVTFAGKVFHTGGQVLNWLIAIMLIVALMLSALNAIMGCARSLHQMSVDGQFPRFFQRINKHGVPSYAMGFNVVCSLLVVLAGGAVENARLLLASGLGSAWVGRCFMEHPRDSALVLRPRSSRLYRDVAFYDLHVARDGTAVVGRLALAGMRTAMRVVDRTPPLRRRMTESMLRYRGADRDDETTPTAPVSSSR
jgi:hypothetical protein